MIRGVDGRICIKERRLTAVTIGKFDGFHKGHRLLLEALAGIAAATKKGMPTCVCKIDFPGPSLLTHEEQRQILDQYGIYRMRRLAFTDMFASQTPEEFVRRVLVGELGTSHVVVGCDFCFGYNHSGNVDTLRNLGEKYGFSVTAIDKLQIDGEPVSSTRIRSLISEGRIEAAEELLGTELCYKGMVCHGREIGRTIGFPTLNLRPDPDKILPLFGVYRSIVTTEQGEFQGITNIGKKPTVEQDGTPIIETFLNDFSGNLYDTEITVRLQHFLRPERKFDSVEALQQQLQKDLDSCFRV